MKRDKSEIEQKNKEMEFDLNKLQQRLDTLQQSEGDNAEKLAMQYEALQEMDRMMVESESEIDRLKRALDFERKCRQEDASEREAEVRDLQEQINEYEEETMSLQNQLYQLKLQQGASNQEGSPNEQIS